MLFLESHSFSFRQPSGARGTFSVGSGGAETAILLTRGGFLLRHREGLEVAFCSLSEVFYYSFGSVSAQRWAFIASPGARVRFSILGFEQARGSSII